MTQTMPESALVPTDIVEGELVPMAWPSSPGAPAVKVRPAAPVWRILPPEWRAHAGRGGVIVARQALRLVHPLTVARLIGLLARGAGRGLLGLARFATGADMQELKAAKPERHHTAVKARCIGLVVAGTGGYVLVATRPGAGWFLAGAGLAVCAYLGRAGKPLLADAPELFGANDALVRQAFADAGLAKDPGEIKLATPVMQTGDGWTTTVALPSGTTADKAVRRRGEIASALNLPVSRLTVKACTSSARRVRVSASDREPLDGPPVANPLVAGPRAVDLWQPLPIGVDESGQTVAVELVFNGILVGGLPRRGKSVLMANILTGALLDPHAQLWMVDGKGLDSLPLIPHAARHAGRDLDEFVQLMADLESEMDRRYDRLAALEVDKLSRQVCRAEMPLIVLSIDELARYTASSDKRAQRAVETLRNVVSVGMAAGIIPVLATQKPSSTIVPTDLRDLISVRAAVACSTRAQSKTILGDESTVSAVDLPQDVIGATWLVGASRQPIMFRPYLVDGPALRAVAGTVSAPGRDVAEPLARVLSAMGEAEKVPSEELAGRLGMTVDDLAMVLRQFGVRPGQLGRVGEKANPRGYRKADILAATRAAI